MDCVKCQSRTSSKYPSQRFYAINGITGRLSKPLCRACWASAHGSIVQTMRSKGWSWVTAFTYLELYVEGASTSILYGWFL